MAIQLFTGFYHTSPHEFGMMIARGQPSPRAWLAERAAPSTAGAAR
jgi:hypothetical protein